MPISIPTSIAGISVPGAINGPLQLLYGNKYEFGSHRYPRNLGTDSTRSHVIRFTSYMPDKDKAPKLVSNGDAALSSAVDAAVALLTGVASGTEGVIKAVQGPEVQQGLKNVASVINDVTAADVIRKVYKTVSLYIPDTINVQYSNKYHQDRGLTETLGKPYFLAQVGASLADLSINNVRSNATAADFGNSVANDPGLRAIAADFIGKRIGAQPGDLQGLALRTIGQAINPQLQVLFEQTGFRSFQFDFLFTPYSKEETEEVKKIIEFFKYSSAPEIKRGSFGFAESLFVDVPYPFEIKFLYKGKENPYVHKMGRSVLENVSVDYGPNGWATFNDGSPVQIRMTLQFLETVIVDKNRIKAGY